MPCRHSRVSGQEDLTHWAPHRTGTDCGSMHSKRMAKVFTYQHTKLQLNTSLTNPVSNSGYMRQSCMYVHAYICMCVVCICV